MSQIKYSDVIKLKYPDKKPQRFVNDTYEGIIWSSLDTTPNPSKEELDGYINDLIAIDNKITDAVNDLNSTNTVSPLSAAQGKILNDKIDAIINSNNVKNYFNKINAISGTSLINYDNSTPSIYEGTQITSVVHLVSSVNSKMVINGNLVIDCSSSNRNIILSFFRNNTCIGVVAKNFVSSGRPSVLPFTILDLELGDYHNLQNVTYSVRVGANNNCTWYINRQNNSVFNGKLASSIIFSEYI